MISSTETRKNPPRRDVGRPTDESATAGAVTLTGERCPQCDRPTSDLVEIVSRHRTSQGVILYQRCHCGRLHVRLQRPLFAS